MPIPFKATIKSLSGVASAPKMGHIKSYLNLEEIPNLNSLQDLTLNPTRAYQVDRINSIDKYIGEGVKIPRRELNQLFRFDDDSIDAVFRAVDTDYRSLSIARSFRDIANTPSLGGNLKHSIKSWFRGLDQSFKQTTLRHEGELLNAMREQGVEVMDAFSQLHNDPINFSKTYGVSQDDFIIKGLLSKGDAMLPDPVKKLANVWRAWDQKIMTEIQDLGVPIGSLEDYAFPVSIPLDTPYNIGIKNFQELVVKHIETDEQSAAYLTQSLLRGAGSSVSGGGFGFNARYVKFRSPESELAFYRGVHSLTDTDSFMNLMLLHKKNLVKRASLFLQFGHDPKSMIRKTLGRLKLAGGDVKEMDRLKGNFDRLIDVYQGRHNIDSDLAEGIRRTLSQFLTLSTSASGGSFIRNQFDFNINRGVAKAAIYNPNYTLGGTILDIVRDIGPMVAYAFKGDTRKRVDNILNIMGFGNQLESFSHWGMLSYEDIFDITDYNFANKLRTKTEKGLSKIANSLTKMNDKIYTISGQHAFTNIKRAKHLMVANQMWTNLLDSVSSYADWVKPLNKIDRMQVEHLRRSFGIGEKEFNFLKTVEKVNVSGVPGFITPEQILKTKGYDKNFRQSLANKWRSFIYNSTLDATPIPTIADSITANTLGGASSWMRLAISPFFKFADVTQAQWNRVAERVKMNAYGDLGQSLGVRGIAGFAKAGLIYTGGFMGIGWAKDILYGRDLTDYTDWENVRNAFLFSGWGGYTAMLGGSVLEPFGTNPGGVYGLTPAGSSFKQAKRIFEGISSDDPVKQTRAIQAAMKSSGVSTLWFLRGIMNRGVERAMLTPHQRKTLDRQREMWKSRKKGAGGAVTR